MKTPYRIFIILFSFAVPYLLLVFITLAAFLQFGSGSNSAEKFEAQEHWWIVFYMVIAIIHLMLLYRLLRQWHLALKVLILFLIAGTYGYYAMELIS